MLKFGLALALVLFSLPMWSQTAATQATSTPTTSTAAAIAAPKVMLLVYQQLVSGKAGTRQMLEIEIARNFTRLGVPVSWIEVESLTGPPQVLFLDPANSFAEIDKAGTVLAQVYGTHPDLAQFQQQIEDLVVSSRTVTAVLREDLSLNPATLTLAKARYLRVRTVQLRPERERDFINAFTNNQIKGQPAARAWAAYQVNAGMPEITLLFIEPLRSMQDLDQALPAAALELAPLGVASSSEADLYAVHPEMSHVSKEFAATDPTFWMLAATP
jgi:hypothetical protein